MLLANARVHGLHGPEADAILLDGGVVVDTGTVRELRDRAGGHVAELDCGGATVLPGLVDSHLHALATATALTEVDLRGTRSLDDATRRIADHAHTLAPGAWVTGGRWDANRWSDVREPNRVLLDALVPDRPVAVWSIDFHTLWVNGAALAAVGIDGDTPDPRGGRIVRDADGQPTGVLREDAATLVERRIPPPAIEARADMLRSAQQRWHAEGLTGVHDFDGTTSREAWEALLADGTLTMRVVKYLRLDEWDWAKTTGWRSGTRAGERFVRGGLKLFSDGSLGSRTCHMTHAFLDDGAPNFGLPIASTEVLVEQITDALAHDVAVAIHAIGDQANRSVITALERTLGTARTPLRHRIEHTQFLQADDVPRLAALGVVAAMQPTHCTSDLPLLGHVDPDGLLGYPWSSLLDAGVPLAFGSDAPVESTNPWHAIASAMTRATDGDPYQPEQRLTAREALLAHTVGSAFAAGLEGRAGTLAPGMDADLVVVDVDPFQPTPSEQALREVAASIHDTTVACTVVAGDIVHTR